MKFEYETRSKKSLTVDGWCQYLHRLVVINESGGVIRLTHESQIPSDWPESAKAYCAKEIRKHRPEGEHEARDDAGILWTLNVSGKCVHCDNGDQYSEFIVSRGEIEDTVKMSSDAAFWARCLAYYDKHATLAPNQYRGESGKVRTLADDEVWSHEFTGLFRLRWNGSVQESRQLNSEFGEDSWSPFCGFGCHIAQARAEAWFAKNKPEEWSVGEWQTHGAVRGVAINGPGICLGNVTGVVFKHESELSQLPTPCPQHIIDLARARILRRRPIDDRDFQTGDVLVLYEFDPVTSEFTGKATSQNVTYVARGGLIPDGFCVMSITPTESTESTESTGPIGETK